MSKILIISASPRVNGNSDILAEQFKKGAEEAGNKVETIHLRNLNYGFCKGCLACQKTGKCVLKDDIADVFPKIMEADKIVLASPVYYYSLSGQMKTFLDRCNPLYGRMKGKTFYFILTMTDKDKSNMERVFDAFEGFTMCFDDITPGGRVYGAASDAKGAVVDTPAYKDAYMLGKEVMDHGKPDVIRASHEDY